jgi:hypothetical protein
MARRFRATVTGSDDAEEAEEQHDHDDDEERDEQVRGAHGCGLWPT